jgi:hypothetical protein
MGLLRSESTVDDLQFSSLQSLQVAIKAIG